MFEDQPFFFSSIGSPFFLLPAIRFGQSFWDERMEGFTAIDDEVVMVGFLCYTWSLLGRLGTLFGLRMIGLSLILFKVAAFIAASILDSSFYQAISPTDQRRMCRAVP